VSVAPDGARVLATLQQLERELVELRYTQRLDAQERVRESLRRLAAAGAPQAVLERAPAELAAATGLERVLVSRVRPERIEALARWERGVQTVAGLPVTGREQPTIEVARALERGVVIVDDPPSRGAGAGDSPVALALGWRSFVLAAVVLRDETVALVHAGAEGRPLGAFDAELVGLFADGLTAVLERALLEELLRRNRAQLAAAARFIEGAPAPEGAPPAPPAPADPLTARELEVLELLAAGAANREIARALTISQGTVKYHVKNILRKLRARSRAGAVARHMGARR
jgi:DNA-binding NarL/FixJ family response regulator